MTTSAESPPVPPVQVDIVVPVRNEERDLRPGVERLHDYLLDRFPFNARITIADNGSSDGTWREACLLAERFPEVRAIRLAEPGRGRALSTVWSGSDAQVLAYMDVDLSTDLDALLPLVAPLLSGHSDLAIGTRLAHGSNVVRGPQRELISRAYNALLHVTLRTRFSDAQCGFKAIRAEHARELLPLVDDTGWFFDTELLVLAERVGLRIHEVPVDWVDDPRSTVDIVQTAVADIKGVARIGWGMATGSIPVREVAARLGRRTTQDPGTGGQLVRFAGVGVLSTIAYAFLYLVMRTVMPAQAANALSLLATAVGNTAANRRLTFGVRGSAGVLSDHAKGLVTFLLGLAVTSGSLAALHAVSTEPGRLVELAVLTLANVCATVLRFVLYRWWVFRGHLAVSKTAVAVESERSA